MRFFSSTGLATSTGLRLCRRGGFCRIAGVGDDSGSPTEAVEVCGYSLGVVSEGLYVVKTDLTACYRLGNLRNGAIAGRSIATRSPHRRAVGVELAYRCRVPPRS